MDDSTELTQSTVTEFCSNQQVKYKKALDNLSLQLPFLNQSANSTWHNGVFIIKCISSLNTIGYWTHAAISPCVQYTETKIHRN